MRNNTIGHQCIHLCIVYYDIGETNRFKINPDSVVCTFFKMKFKNQYSHTHISSPFSQTSDLYHSLHPYSVCT